jgi:predicted ATPase/DNA-binding winged helix-turn-helix (wHTH) protein
VSPPERYEFGGLVLDADLSQLLRDGVAVPLQPKAFELLLLLVRQPGRLLGRAELEQALWPEVHITDQSLRQLLHRLRLALGEEAAFLETVPRKGLRFLGAASPAPAPRARASLPAERDTFCGRARELAALDQLRAAGRRLITVTGPAGMGKTRLVTRWAHQRPAAEVTFCDLVGVGTADELVHRVAAALELELVGEPHACLAERMAELGPRCVVLDNFEQLVPCAAETAGAWLDRAAELSLVVTSRQVLGIAGEALLPLAPLPESDGLALFEDRARALDPGFVSSPGEGQALVALLDGIPLAIELAASRQRLLGTAGLVSRMGDRFRLLATPGRDRHATLLASLELSWELLGEDERAAFCALSVFEGELDIEAACAVLEQPGGPWALDLLQALLGHSLLQAREPGVSSMLPTLRQYAARKLDERGPQARLQAEERHGRWAASLFEVTGRASPLPSQRQALRPHLPDLLAACSRAVQRGDGPVAASTAWTVWVLVTRSGPYEELARLLPLVAALPLSPLLRARVADVAAGISDRRGGLDSRPYLEQALLAHDAAEHPAARADLLVQLASLEMKRGLPPRAGPLLEEALALSREVGAPALQAQVLASLGQHVAGEERLPLLQQALELYGVVGDLRGQGSMHERLGSVNLELGRLDRALDHYAQSIALLQSIEHTAGVGVLLYHQAHALGALGRYEEAQASAEQSVAVSQQAGAHRRVGQAQLALARILQLTERLAPALEQVDLALALFRRVNDRRWLSLALADRADVLGELGRLPEAWEALRQMALLEEAVLRRAPYTLLVSARLHARAGELEQARALLIEAEQALPASAQLMRAELLCERAHVEQGLQRSEIAASLAQQAKTISLRFGQLPQTALQRRLDALLSGTIPPIGSPP